MRARRFGFVAWLASLLVLLIVGTAMGGGRTPGLTLAPGAGIAISARTQNGDGTESTTIANADPGSAVNVAAGTNITSVTHVGSTFTINAAGGGTASCPISLASCVTGTLGEGNGGTGANLTGCTAGSVFQQGASQFNCINPLPAANGGTGQTGLPLTEINGGTDANLTGCGAGSVFVQGASQFQCVVALGTSAGGTGLTGPGASGNALLSNGTIWTTAPLPTPLPLILFASSGNVLIPATSTDTLLVTQAITVPAGGSNVLVSADFFPSNPDVANDDISLCISTSSSSCASAIVTDLYTVPPSTGMATGKGAMHDSILLSGVAAGSHSFSLLATSNTQVFHCLGRITVELSN